MGGHAVEGAATVAFIVFADVVTFLANFEPAATIFVNPVD
jgi:hypothetical protein